MLWFRSFLKHRVETKLASGKASTSKFGPPMSNRCASTFALAVSCTDRLFFGDQVEVVLIGDSDSKYFPLKRGTDKGANSFPQLFTHAYVWQESMAFGR